MDRKKTWKQIGTLCLAGAIMFGIWGCNTTKNHTASDSESDSDTGSADSEATEEVYTAKENIDADQVAGGVSAYTDGVTQAYGAATAIHSGAKQLADSGTQLREGMSGLVTGTNTLLSAIRTFDRDGIEELTKMFGEDLQTILDKVEALKKADESYINYGGIEDGKTGSVVFMIETEELTK